MHQANTMISLGTHPVWSVFAIHKKKHWVLGYSYWVHSEDWLDWVDAKADLSLCWMHMSVFGFDVWQLKY